jgi:hypothetical protein
MRKTIDLRLYASLQQYMPPNADQYMIEPGMRITDIVHRLKIPATQPKLIFIDGIKKDLDTTLGGGERVAIFPPIGGG